METTMKRIENSLGWKLAIFALIAYYAQLGVFRIIGMVNQQWLADNAENASLILPIILLDIIAFPLFLLLTRKLPKTEVGNEKITVGKFIVGIPVMSFIVLTGSLIGAAIQGLLTPSSSTAGLAEVLTGSSLFWRVLYVGILAPIVEELIFRKTIIDRLAYKGKWFAIFVSALCFGLFHGNFAQFFYAFVLGIVWGVIYTRTGKIYITMGYHLVINMSSSVIGAVLASKMDPSVPSSMVPFYSFVGLRIILAVIGLIVIIATGKKVFKLDDEEGLKGGKLFKSAFSSWGLWIYYVLCIGIFVITIVSGRVQAKAANTISIADEFEVTVADGKADINEKEYPFSIYVEGDYVVKYDWFDNEEPGFIMGARVESEDGTSMFECSGALLKADMLPTHLKAGTYKVVLTILESEEEFADYAKKYFDEVINLNYDKLGLDGKYNIKASFTFTKN